MTIPTIRSALFLLVMAPFAADAAGVYRCTDATGKTVFSDRACAGGSGDVSRKYSSPRPKVPAPLEPDMSGPAPDQEELGNGPATPSPARPQSGADNVQKFLEHRAAEMDKREQDRAQWLESSAELDRQRQERKVEEAKEERYQDCLNEKRVRELRGQSSSNCYRQR